MAIDKLNPKLIETIGASDGDALVYVSANGQLEFGSVAVDTSALSASINTVQDNVATNATTITTNKSISDTFGSYANSTFSTGVSQASVDTVQDNVATNASSITALNSEVDQLGSYANSTFATDTNLNTVQDNVATNATTITTNKSISDQFGSYANSTFATDTNLNTVQSNVTSVGGELDAFGTYANSTFSSGSGNTQVYVGSTLVSNTALLLGAGDGINLAANTTSKTVTITTNMSNITSQVIAADGSTNAFTVSKAASNANMLLVSVNGLLLNPTEYTISSTTLTLSNTDPLIAGSNVEVRYFDFFQFGGVSAGGGGSPSYSFVGSTTGYSLGGTWGPSGTSPLSASSGIRKLSFSSETSALSTATLDTTRTLSNHFNVPSDGAKVHYLTVSSIDNGDVYAVATASDTNAASLGTNFTEAHPYLNPVYGTSSGSQAYFGGHNSQYPGTTSAETLFKFPFAASASTTEVGEMYTTPGGPSSVYLRDVAAYSDIAGSYGWYVGGETSDPSPNPNNERITKVSFSSDSPGADVAELTIYRNDATPLQSTTTGYVYGGNQQDPYIQGTDVIEKFPFASNSPATDIAEATATRRVVSGMNHTTAGYVNTGFPGSPPYVSYQKDILKLPFSSDTSTVNTGNDFDLFTAGNAGSGQV